MNRIWLGIIVISLLYGIVTGRGGEMTQAILSISQKGFTQAASLVFAAIFWNAVMVILVDAGVITKLSHFLRPIFKKLMPNLSDEETLQYMSLNIAATVFGLGSAATPSGLKAIKRMQDLALVKNEATDEMITFLVLNTAGVSLIPTSVLAIRQLYGAAIPTDFMMLALISTICALTSGLIFDYIFRKRRLLRDIT